MHGEGGRHERRCWFTRCSCWRSQFWLKVDAEAAGKVLALGLIFGAVLWRVWLYLVAIVLGNPSRIRGVARSPREIGRCQATARRSSPSLNRDRGLDGFVGLVGFEDHVGLLEGEDVGAV